MDLLWHDRLWRFSNFLYIFMRWWENYIYQIGNAAINDETDSMGMVEFAWSHAIISDQLHANIFKLCNFSADVENQTLSCLNHYGDFLISYSKIDVYNIYAPTCLSPSSSSSIFKRLVGAVAPRIFTKRVRQINLRSLENRLSLNLLCFDDVLFFGLFHRNCGISYQRAMIHALQIMLKNISIERMFKGLYMLMLLNFPILTLLAGPYNF